MTYKRLFGSTLAAVVASAFAATAGAQEWRGGGYGGPRCGEPTEGYGKATLNPFSDRRHEARKARDRAVSDWTSHASAAYGPRYTNWDIAAGRDVSCNGGGGAIECHAIGRPCRGGGYGGYRD